ILFFRQGQSSNALVTKINGFDDQNDFYELGYLLNDADTFLVLHHYNKNKKLIDETKYIRVNEVQPSKSLEYGFQYAVNKKLFSGTYAAIDTTGQEFIVSLTNDGRISGLPNRSTFYILTDFVTEDEESPDQICFDIQTSGQDCYGFEMRGDTISIFKPQKNKKDTTNQANEVIFNLIKQK
ncbi:MAG: hypothetical protein J7502_08420, partial [Flavisolibacter sp.]|nr:hypothetical protein [Flavisolibacter sp.]